MMNSFMQTMFVQDPPASYSTSSSSSAVSSSSFSPSSPPRNQFPHAAKPLQPLHSNVLAASESCLHLPAPITQPQSAYESPLHKQFRGVLAQASQGCLFGGTSVAANDPSQHNQQLPAAPQLKPTQFGSSQPSPIRPQQNRAHITSNTSSSPSKPPSPLKLHGLGFGLDRIGHRADNATISTSNNKPNRVKNAFRPQETQKGTNSWQLKQFAEATLGSGSLRKVVKLPPGEDRDEWLAVNVVDFYNQINLLYGAITEFCSPQTCPEMKATDEYEYLWHCPPEFQKPTRLAAPKYIANLLTWVSGLLSDPELFPTQPGVPFPDNFLSNVKQIFKRMYRIYAHIYCHHYGVIRGLGLEPHLNTGFKHYVLFVDEFGLADESGGGGGGAGKSNAKAEWFGPLGPLVESMLKND